MSGKKPGRRSAKRVARVPKISAPVLPRQATADMQDPAEFAAWVFAGMPHMQGAPIAFPVWYLHELSKRLWEAGFRHHAELQTVKYVIPTVEADGPAVLASAGRWVPVDTPDDEIPSLADQLDDAQKRALVAALGLDVGSVDEGEDDGRVPYVRADGSTVMVTPAQARSWRNAKKARDEA